MVDVGVKEAIDAAIAQIVAGIDAIISHRFVPYNGKIADISESDTNKHNLDLATALSETRKIIAVIVAVRRQSGSGGFAVYPNEGNVDCGLDVWGGFPPTVVIKDGTQRLQYAQWTPGDDFGLYCMGYIVEA